MAWTDQDLQSAAAKLATIDFTVAELEAIAATIRGETPRPANNSDIDDVTGFAVFEPNGEPLWTKGFIPDIAGLVGFSPGRGGGTFTATGDLGRIITLEEGRTA